MGWLTLKGEGQWPREDPDKANHMMDRGGFFIHGRGPHGSDGCIVPLNSAELVDLLRALEKDGGGVLTVLRQMARSIAQEVAALETGDRSWGRLFCAWDPINRVTTHVAFDEQK
jgi:hypothetical protein